MRLFVIITADEEVSVTAMDFADALPLTDLEHDPWIHLL